MTLAAVALASTLVSLSLARRCKRLGAQLDRRYRDLEEATHGRAEELSTLAHQIRNPLGTISLNASLLESGGLPEERRERHLATIRRAVDRADRVLRHLVDLH